jgi:hypothetical protein
MNNSIPYFEWSIENKTYSNQTGFQMIIDNNITFSDIDFDSGIQLTSNNSWQFPNGTNLTSIPDGKWYFKLRLRNGSGNWSEFSGYSIFIIDSTPPLVFTPQASPSGWTNSTPELTFLTTDNESGIERYEVDIDGGGFISRTSPFTPQALSDGIHNITVRAFDTAGNYIDAVIEISIDSVPPAGLSLSASPGGWTANTQPQIMFSTSDNSSGVSHYALRIDSGDFTNQTSPYTLPV